MSVDGGILIDNLTLCSADRLLCTRYRHLEDEAALLIDGLAATLFIHDVMNLSNLVESIVCHDRIFVNAEYIDRWNTNIGHTTLHPLASIIQPVYWPEELGREAQIMIDRSDHSISASMDSTLNAIAGTVFRASHRPGRPLDTPSGRSIVRRLILPGETTEPRRDVSWYIMMGAEFYLMCSQWLGVPYKPSAIRAQMLSSIIDRESAKVKFDASAIALAMLQRSRDQVMEEVLGKVFELNSIELGIPSLLTAVLRESNRLEDVLLIAQQIRTSKEAQHFRDWTKHLSINVQNGDISKIGEFIRDIEAVAGNVQKLLNLSPADTAQLMIGWGPVTFEKTFGLPTLVNRPVRYKRHLWLLHKIQAEALRVASISVEIDRVLVQRLPKWFGELISEENVSWRRAWQVP
jgi:hypothetical protein